MDYFYNMMIFNTNTDNTIDRNVTFNNNIIVTIEGNIGSGKSTLLQELKNHFKDNKQILFLDEPVQDWETVVDENGTTMLKLFYENQDKHAFAFQMMAYISRLAILKNAVHNNHDCIIITERCLYTDKMVFAKMLYESKSISLENYTIYTKWFNTFIVDYPINKVIYVNTHPSICYNRISQRAREGESTIPLEYLTNCHIYHENMLNTNNEDCFCKKQIVLNGNIDIFKNTEELSSWIFRIEYYIGIDSYSKRKHYKTYKYYIFALYLLYYVIYIYYNYLHVHYII
jgi:deoxycitidine kinase/deoxyguanosine kinase